MKTLLIALLLVGSSQLGAEPPPEGAGSGAFKIGGGVSPPTIVQKVPPDYTPEAKASRIEGRVLLGVTISKEGKVTKHRIISVDLKNKDTGEKIEGDYGLAEKAKEAVLQWEFKPGAKEGQPVDVLANIEVNFRLQ